MATNTSLVTQITGQAWIRGAHGALTPLQTGMTIPSNADVITSSGASVQLQVDGQPPLIIGENRDVQLGAEVAQPDVDPATSAAAAPAEPDTTGILAALEAGADPFDNLDPTAAVIEGGGPGDGGSSFTRIAAVLELTTPLGLEYPRPTYPRTEEIRLGGVGSNRAPELTGSALSAAGLLDQINDDSDMVEGLNVGQHFTDPDGHELTFTATGLPPGLTLNPITGIIEGKLDSSASQGGPGGDGVYKVVITATDPYGSSVDLPFTWTTHNPPPVAEDDVNTTEENTVVTGNVLSGDNDGKGADVDPDGDKLTVTEITNADGDKVSAGKPITGVNGDDGKGGGTFTINPDGSYTFEPGKDFDYLADGESTTTKVTYKISDGDGGFDEATLTITVTGTNDAPVINVDGTDDAATITEVKDLDPDENIITHKKEGVITFADADDSDTHTIITTPQPDPGKPPFLGTLVAVLNPDKTISWTFEVDDNDIDHLGAGEALEQKYIISVSDGNGGTVDQTVTITIQGTNDAPIIDETVSDVTGAVTEDAADPTTSGTLVWDDADTTDTHTWTAKGDGQGAYGKLTINDKGAWVYTLDNGKAAHLAKGDTATDTITVIVTDSAGATDEQVITITITGTNDTPVIDGDKTQAAGTVKESGDKNDGTPEPGTPEANGTLVATDVDDNATLTWSLRDAGGQDVLSLKGKYGSITLDPATGKWTYTLDNDADITQQLNNKDRDTEVFVARVQDEHGAWAEQPITVTVEGTNDAPVLVADENSVKEEGVKQGGNTDEPGKSVATGNVLTGHVEGTAGPGKDTDIDSDTLTITDVKQGANSAENTDGVLTLQGKYGTLVMQPDGSYEYTLDNDKANHLAAGKGYDEVFTYVVNDGDGATVDTTLTITVTGTNDAPEITSNSTAAMGEVTESGHDDKGLAEPGTPTTGGTLTSSDADDDATATWSLQAKPGQMVESADNGGTKINGKYGWLTLTKDGKWTYELDNTRTATQSLKDGDNPKEEFTARVQDEHGAWADQPIIVTVNGTNDAPVANDDLVTFYEDLPNPADPNQKSSTGNVLNNDSNPDDGDGPTTLEVTNFKIEGDPTEYPADGTEVDIGGIGTFSMDKDGNYVFTPKENYSGKVPEITYTIQEPSINGEAGLKDSATLNFEITPVADKPKLDGNTTGTDEDVSILLGLAAPVVTDGTDHNGDLPCDNPERLGVITLKGIPSGAQLLDANGNVVANGGSDIKILIIEEGGHISHTTQAVDSADPSILRMTQAEYEALRVNPPKDSHVNIKVTVSVTSYEVDDSGNPLPNIPGATSTAIVDVQVLAVTDDVTLTIAASETDSTLGKTGTFVIDEDNVLNLKDVLNAQFEDLDGSERRWVTIKNETGQDILVNGQVLKAGASIDIQQGGLSANEKGFGDIKIGGTKDFSGDLNGIKVTLNAQDRDGDNPEHTTLVTESDVTLNLYVNPIAGDISVGGVTGKEDSAIRFLANVALTDTDGSEKINHFAIKGVPVDWIVKDGAGNVIAPDEVGGTTYTLPPSVGGVNLGDYANWTVTPPAHSSKDVTFKVDVTTEDTKVVNGESITDTNIKTDVPLKVTVTPQAEKVGVDSDGDGVDDLTMTKGHDYSTGVGGQEDLWFALNVSGQGAGKDFNLKDGWFNQDGKPEEGSLNPESADGGTENTFALLTPVLVDGFKNETAAGSKFSYVDGNGKTITLTYNGTDPVEIPMEYLHTVKFQGPPNVSGKFEIGVQAKTVDTDPDTGATSEAISGNATLEGIFIAPIADHVTLGIGGAHGKEDTDIPLIIRPSSADSSESFNIEISGIPTGAILIYNGHVVEVIDGVARIDNFDSNAPLTVKPPHNSNQDFDLTVKAESVDTIGGVTDKSGFTESQKITVRVDGVADEVDVVFNDKVTFTEAALDGGGNTIKLSDIVDTANTKMHDNDGSETLTYRISGLPDGFTVEGATFMGGEGDKREWTFTADQLKEVKIKVPEHYSGKLPGQLTAITTENDGDSLTGKPQEWDVNITPSPESDMTTGSTVVEDQRSKLDFSIGNNHGDTNEELTTVWIKASDVDDKDFTLFLGNKTFAEALATGELVKVTKQDGDGNDVDYYELSGQQIDNVYAKVGDNFASNLPNQENPSFELKYEITDKSNDGSQTPVMQEKDGSHTLTVTPVTDEVELTLGSVTGDGVTGNATDGFVLTQGGKVSVNITLEKLPDGNADNQPDYDGSEQFTQVIIEGVPNGMLVDGLTVDGVTIGQATYLGDGKWIISISESEHAKFTGPIHGQVQFTAGDQLNGSLKDLPISITVVTQDKNSDTSQTEIKTDKGNWNLSTEFGTGGSTPADVTVDFEQNPDFTGTEDTGFKLSDAFTGTVDQADANFTVVLTLPKDAQVSYKGVDLTPTVIDGKEVWIISGKGGQDALNDLLDDIVVTPPLNFNDNHGDFVFDATLTATLPSGISGQGKVEGADIPIIPVTDPAVIEVVFSAADDTGKPTKDAAQEGRDVAITLNITSPHDGPTTLGDQLYIKLDESNGLNGGILKDADGNTLTLQTVEADNALGLAPGEYYVIDLPVGSTAPHGVDLVYTPADGQEFKDGLLAIDAWVQNQEAGDIRPDPNSWETGKGSGTGALEAVNNGYDLSIGHENESGDWVANVVIGNENQDGGIVGAIQLGIKDAGLIDGDGSEQALAAMLKNLPNGFLVYVKDASGTLVLAGNAGGEGSNSWMIPLTADGKLPEIFVLPPQNWSGTLSDIELSVLSGEKGKETWGTSNKFDLVVNPMADGILSFNPAPAFGKEGDIIQLNLNIVMKDDQKAGETDESVETITVTLKGLGEHAAFYVDGQLFDMKGSNFHYDAGNDVYTLSGLSQSDADKLGFIQAAGVDTENGKVIVTVETVETGGGQPSDSKTGEFDLSIFDQPATSGDDTLLYDGGLLDGGKGDDTVWLRFGEDLDFSDDDTAGKISNIETFDLTEPGYNHTISELGADDVFSMTDHRNILAIKADEGDKVSFKDDDWKFDTDKSSDEYDVYTGKTSTGQEVEVHITKDFHVDGLLIDDADSQSIDSLLDDSGVATASAGDSNGASASALADMDHSQQNQLINDLIQQGKLATDTQ
ncbi:MAG: retention module-containing protein [Burkholderiaceae bacterium]|nr:retention module-containing protein [Burkholderiaceae bacterium]